MMGYTFSVEHMRRNFDELWPLYQLHYAEMQERLANDGVIIAPLKPRLDEYFKAADAGYLVNLVVRTDAGEPVGYCNVYVTADMHNSETIAQEDTVFVRKEHRNGIGKKLVQFGLEELRKRGVKRLHVQAMTDLRVEKLWKRMGFKPVATAMIYDF